MKKLRLLITAFLSIGTIVAYGQYTDIHDFAASGADSAGNPYGSLISVGQKLYGVTSGANSSYGEVFSINPDGSRYKPLVKFDTTNPVPLKSPEGTLTPVGGKLYGFTVEGGANSDGAIFSVDTNGKNYADLADFGSSGSSPMNPVYGAMAFYKDKLYGMTEAGGTHNYGCVFSYDTATMTLSTVYNFSGVDGRDAFSQVIYSAGKLYGMTRLGGTQGYGNVFTVDTNGNNYKDLLDFTNSNGRNPIGSLLLSGKVLYGMTEAGGSNGEGVVFSVDTTGNNYKDILDFNSTNGLDPYGSLILSGNYLYGMTNRGGANSLGVIFSVDTNGNEYKDIHDFAGATGDDPWGDLMLMNGVLYGMTREGGHNSKGVVFSDGICSLLYASAQDSSVTCYGYKGTVYTVKDTGGPTPYNYVWAGIGQSTDTVRGLSAGVYTLTLTDANGCTAIATATITQPAGMTIVDDSVGTTSCNGSAGVNVSGGTSPYTYMWSPGGGTSDTISDKCPGTYTCVVSQSNGCSQTAIVTIVNTTGIGNIAGKGNGIAIYPNPNDGMFAIQMLNNEQGICNLEVYNTLGQQIMTKTLNDAQGDNSINMSNQPNGVYFYRVLTQNGNVIGQGKLVIQK